MNVEGGRLFGIIRMPVRSTGWGHLLWVPGAAIVGMAVSAVFAGLLELPRGLYLIFYVASAGALFYGYLRWSGIDAWKGIRERWMWGLIGGGFFGFLAVQTVLVQPSSPRPEGAELVFDLAWLGVVYGAVDGLLLTVLPVLATWQALVRFGWTRRWYGRVGAGVLALVASMLVVAAYHLGYPEFRGPQVLLVIFGVGAQGLAYLLTRSPIAPVVAHVAMHVAAVLHGIESVSQLPPHY